MKIEVVAIGNEVLAGLAVNTNAAFISKELSQAGMRPTKHLTLPDDRETLLQELGNSLKQNDVVITTGGLGPTCDDITRAIAAELFHSDFRLDENIAKELSRRYGTKAAVTDQATVPTKAKVIENHIGSAPALILEEGPSCLILLPGVPSEMQDLFMRGVLPFLKNRFKDSVKRFSKRLHLVVMPDSAISEALVDPILRQIQKMTPHLEIGIYPSPGILMVQFTSDKQDDPDVDAAIKELSKHFSRHVLDIPSGKIEELLQQRFLSSKWTLSIAESCTGGRLAARLTALPGSSGYFLGSIVAYSNESKTKFLEVPPDTIQDHGAVSSETVSAMMKGILNSTKSDFSIAVTGIAGPGGGTENKPVGLIWAAIGHRDHSPYIFSFRAPGHRNTIMEFTVNVLLAQLLKYADRL